MSVLAAVHGDGLEAVAEENSDVDSTADNVQVLKSRVTMENIMRAMSDQSRDAFTVENSEDESSSSYSSACEDPVDGEENSSHGSSGGDEGAEAEMREVMTMEDG